MRTQSFLILLIISIITYFNEVNSLNLLGVFPYQGKSHFFVFKPYLEELAQRGHNVTVISYFPRKTPLKNYHDISLADKAKVFEDVFPVHQTYLSLLMIIVFLFTTGTENCQTLLADENVQNLWKSKMKFDLVMVEQFNSDCSLGLAHALGAPVVGMTSHVLMPWHYERLGVPYNRFFVYFITVYKFLSQRVDQDTLAQYIDDVPPLEELGRNMKFMLVYSNFVLTGSNLFPSNVIEVGGYHVTKAKPLPHGLQKFIDESEHGVIYISFGSMLRAVSTPKDKIEIIVKALVQLPQRIIWKWEEETLPGNPKNIYVSKWLPQNDILAQPKVLAFYSHCGLLGTTEAIYHGVPMIGMPIFGDQSANAASVEKSGLGVQIQFNELTAEGLLEKFKIVLDPKFRKGVKEISQAWHDRPVSPMDTAIFWTEFAARHHNLTFRSAPTYVPLYQYLCLDIIAAFLIISVTLFVSVKYLISLLLQSKKSKQE